MDILAKMSTVFG